MAFNGRVFEAVSATRRIPDLAYAAEGAQRLTTDPQIARTLLAAVPAVPTLVWGRDELGLGEIWNCNSVIAWVLGAAGLPAGQLRPPPRGRAPGWDAGVAALRLSTDRTCGRDAARRVDRADGGVR